MMNIKAESLFPSFYPLEKNRHASKDLFSRLEGKGGHVEAVLAVAISPKGPLIASGCRNDVIKVWAMR